MDGEQQRRRLREPPHHSDEVSGPVAQDAKGLAVSRLLMSLSAAIETADRVPSGHYTGNELVALTH